MARKFSTIFYILFFFLYGCTSDDFKTYSNSEYGFSFKYPNHWKIAEKSKHHEVLAYEPQEGNNEVLTNISVIIKNNYDIPLNVRGDLAEQEWKDSNDYKNVIILSKKNIKFNNFDAIDYLCEADVLNKKVKWKKIILVKNNLFFDITVTTTKNKFSKKTIDTIINSFLWNQNG